MRTISLFFTLFLSFGVGLAQAQTNPIKWEVSGSAALLGARPHLRQGDGAQAARNSGDDWYAEGRYSATFGHHWTENLKTEVEYATSPEGATYEFLQSSSFEALHRLDQLSARMVWQFGRNQWVHPYVSGGIVGDRVRSRVRHPTQYQYPSGRSSGPMILVPETISEPTWEHKIGFTAGAGAKFYTSRNAFFNTGVLTTHSRAASTISLLAGLGFDF